MEKRSTVLFQRALIKIIINIQNLILSIIKFIFYHSNKELEPKSIFILRSSRLGDFVCAIPAFSLIRKSFPKAHILLLTFTSLNPLNWKKNREENSEWVKLAEELFDEIIALRGPEILKINRIKKLRHRIKELSPELCFILPFQWQGFITKLKNLIFLKFLGVRGNVYGWRVRRLPLFKKIHYRNGENVHAIMAALEPLIEYGIINSYNQNVIKFNVTIYGNDKKVVDKIWKEYGLIQCPIIALFPGGTFKHKQWPVYNFQILCSLLLKSYPVFIIIIGGPREWQLGERIKCVCPDRIINLAGSCNIRQTAEILRRSILFVGNDSGPAHLAAAVGTSCVTIFSAIEYPGSWDQLNNESVILRHSVPCQFCFSFTHCPKGTEACIKSITINEVFYACKQLISRKKITLNENLAH